VDLVYFHSLIEKITKGEVKYIMNVIDLFSKYEWSFPLKEKTANNVAENLNRLFSVTPKYLSSDNGKEFANEIIKNLCKNYNIQIMYGMPYDPKSQGSVEAFNKPAIKVCYLRFLLEEKKNYLFWIFKLFSQNLRMNIIIKFTLLLNISQAHFCFWMKETLNIAKLNCW